MKDIARLASTHHGDPHFPTILLLPGLGMPASLWPKAFIEGLVQEGLHVLAPDNRDSGASERGKGEVSRSQVLFSTVRYLMGGKVEAPYRLEDMAWDAEALLDALGIDRVHVVGISMGGMVAQVLAARAPHRVSSLTIISSASGNPRTGLGKMDAVMSILTPVAVPESIGGSGEKGRFERLVRALAGKSRRFEPGEAEAMASLYAEAAPEPEAVGRQLMAILASGDRRRELAQLAVPTLVVHGTEDPLLPYKAAEELAGCIQGARLLPIPGMGHEIAPEAVGTIVRAIADMVYSKAPVLRPGR